MNHLPKARVLSGIGLFTRDALFLNKQRKKKDNPDTKEKQHAPQWKVLLAAVSAVTTAPKIKILERNERVYLSMRFQSDSQRKETNDFWEVEFHILAFNERRLLQLCELCWKYQQSWHFQCLRSLAIIVFCYHSGSYASCFDDISAGR